MRRRGFNLEWRSPDFSNYGMMALLVKFLVNVAALWIAQWIIPGFLIEGAAALLFGALIFGLVNTIIRPVLIILSCPITLLTLGLFVLIINAAMLALTAWLASIFDLTFEIDTFLAAFLGALVISLVSWILNSWATKTVLGPLDRR